VYGGFISGFAMSSSNANSIFSAPVRQRLLEQLRHGFSPSTSWERLGDRINLDQMFVLIDGILPFEACLYYQVLPLFVDDNQLNLGMVSPDDGVAFEYIRRIISYLNYSLVARSITSEAHQSVLTTYLSHSSKRPRRTPNPYRSAIRSNKEKTIDSGDRLTFLLDDSNPSEAETLDLSVPLPPTPLPPAVPPTLSAPTLSAPKPNPPLLQPVVTPALISLLPALNIASLYGASSVDTLASLPANALLQELFARVLESGIGRLYFECSDRQGRILWSQDGVLQSVIEHLALPALQAVINQLKEMALLPLLPLQKTEQVEVEYLYQQGRVLLRFQFMPSSDGEVATVQILRGAALKFYQRQQISRLERDALGIAKQLQVKLSEIRDRAQAESGLAGARFDVLPNLNQLLQNIGQDLNDWVNPS
jgi:Type II secretion system (T2SS), protein E, N-terminal domain